MSQMDDEALDEDVARLSGKAERLLGQEDAKETGDDEEEILISFAEASRAAKAAAERHPVLCRKFGKNISREEAMQAVEEW